MSDRARIGLLGDDRGHPSHQELNALIPRLAGEFDADASWVPTGVDFDIADYDGLWLVPGSPYENDDAVITALRSVRRGTTPFLGTCGGMQYAVMEFLRTELDQAATHAESDGERPDNAVVPVRCSLYGQQTVVTPVPGSRFFGWQPRPFLGMHYCSFVPSRDSIATLEGSGVVVGATGSEAGAEVLEFPKHPFFITSMFQPHVGASQGDPIHPLVHAFVAAVKSNALNLDHAALTVDANSAAAVRENEPRTQAH